MRRATPRDEMVVTVGYVLEKLNEHTKECAGRWWAVMMAVIGGQAAIIVAMIGLKLL